MQAHEEAFSFIKNSCYYDIPFFQRNYVWTYENWEELLSSLLEPGKCSFLGSLILKQETVKTGDTGRFYVIDGQQRLTTLSILLRACYDTLMKYKDIYPEEAVANFKSCLDNMLFVIADVFTGVKEVKIKHSHIDRPSFEDVINGNYSTDENLAKITIKAEVEEDPKHKKETDGKILLCYKYFRKQLESRDIKEIQQLWNTLIKDDTKFLVNIDLLASENEQAIFDAVNSSGVRLNSSDTIKNALFQKYIEKLKADMPQDKAEQEAIQLYRDSWVKAFMGSDEDAQYWATKHQSGRLFRENIEILLHCVAVIEGFFDPQNVKMSELAQCYKDYISKMSAKELEEFILQIKDYADLYKEKIVANESSVLYGYSDYFARMIQILDELEISTFHPYLLKLLYDVKKEKDEEKFKNDCAKLERYVILHMVCNATTKNYNKECIQLINGESIDVLLEKCEDISKERFVNGLHQMYSNKNATVLLFWVELYKRWVEKADIKELKYTYTLEHIMPQKWGEFWGVDDLPVYDETENLIVDKEKAESIRAGAIYEIGNMTLLNSKLNTSLRNYAFERKLNGEGRKKGIKVLADCLITKEILEKPIWDEREINRRTAEMIGLIKKAWNIDFLD